MPPAHEDVSGYGEVSGNLQGEVLGADLFGNGRFASVGGGIRLTMAYNVGGGIQKEHTMREVCLTLTIYTNNRTFV